MAGIYVHIPFCKKACTYCDFHFTTSLKHIDELTEAICKEITLKKDRLKETIGSIYFGGGTPSVLPVKNLNQIFDTINSCFSVSSDAEITLEANPDDLDKQKLAAFKTLPINRFSIGVQSFFNEDLIWMNRAHNANEAEDCIKRAQDIGFENLSVDLIYGYPQLTNEKLFANIHKIATLDMPHISAYALTVEDKTALDFAIKKGKQKPLNEEQSAEQFLLLFEKLDQQGYEHYEISNYSKPGKNAIHNTNYWKGVPYLGIGPSAHGFDGNERFFNIANNAKYLASLSQNSLPETIERLTSADQFNEYVMTSLRTIWGIDLDKIEKDFGANNVSNLLKDSAPFLEDNQITIENNKILLTKTGKLFADGIAASMFIANEE
jgi:oxygen-independent coproporphyrinogen-3 oxidase